MTEELIINLSIETINFGAFDHNMNKFIRIWTFFKLYYMAQENKMRY